MFFFRLHNLQREEEKKAKRRNNPHGKNQRDQYSDRNRCGSAAGGGIFASNNVTFTPSRLFERAPLAPSDSLDEIALQIPRLIK